MTERPGGGGHRPGATDTVDRRRVDDGGDLGQEPRGVELVVGNQDRSTRPDQRLRVGGLVVAGRDRQGDEDRGTPTAASSATVVPPARQTARSAAASAVAMWSS